MKSIVDNMFKNVEGKKKRLEKTQNIYMMSVHKKYTGVRWWKGMT